MKRLMILLIVVVFSTNLFSQIKTYEGRGDDLITIEKPEKGMPYLLTIVGNTQSRHFSITGYDENNEYTDLLVNTSDPYSGVVGADLGSKKNTVRLEIKAVGGWKIAVWRVGSATKIKSSKSGEGDNVLWVKGQPSIGKIVGNKKSRHFAITAYDKYGNYAKLLVNTSKPYSGRVLLPKNTLLLRVKAVGDWTIQLN